MKQIVGFVGLGNMGRGMATNALKAGFPLIVYDVRPEAVAEMVQAGARGAASLSQLAAEARTVVVMLLNFPQLAEVILGPAGLAATLQPGSTVIVSSTIAPAQAQALAQALAARNIDYVDAPVTGGKEGATGGTLTFMVGAEAAVLEAQRPLLAAMSAQIYHCGPVGTGQVAKMCNQIMCGSALVATAECLTLAAKAGMDRRLLYEIISHGTGDGWMFRHRADRMIADDFATRGRLDIFVKDLGIVLETAEQLQVPLLVVPAARHWVQLAVAAGHATEDDAAVVKIIEEFAGLRPRPGHAGPEKG